MVRSEISNVLSKMESAIMDAKEFDRLFGVLCYEMWKAGFGIARFGDDETPVICCPSDADGDECEELIFILDELLASRPGRASLAETRTPDQTFLEIAKFWPKFQKI
jgi:hypothetical protein